MHRTLLRPRYYGVILALLASRTLGQNDSFLLVPATDTQVNYTSTWSVSSGSETSGNETFTNEPGASAVIMFNGKSV